MAAAPKLGTGARMAALQSVLTQRKGVRNPQALAASIGAKKFGASRMQMMAQASRKRGQ